MEAFFNLNPDGDFADVTRRTVYGELIYRVTPENADEVEDEILEEMIGLQNEGDGPFMLMVFTFNQMNMKAKNFLVRYSTENLHALMETVRDARAAWNYYRDRIEEIGSDTAAAMESLTPHRDPSDDAPLWELCHIGLYHPNFGVNLTREQRGIVYEDFPELAVFRRPENNNRVGRFMGFIFDFNKYQKGLVDDENKKLQCECFYWQNWMKKGEELETRYQIPWFVENNPLKEDNMGDDPVESEIYRIPCMLYALKGQIKQQEWEELARKGFIHGGGVKTIKVRQFLNGKGYQLVERAIKKGVDFVTTSTSKHPRKPMGQFTPVYVDFWENHWMKHFDDQQDFLRHLEWGKRLGLLTPMSAFEFYRVYDNYAVDAMTHFDDKAFMKKTESETEFGEWDYEKPTYKERHGFSNIYYADFEATTNEDRHRPFLLCALGHITDETSEFTAWGEDCAEQFLEHLLERFGEDSKKRRNRVGVRVYFYNLKYDFTFLFPYLYDVNKIQHGNKIYSIKCVYKKHGKSLFIDFWDALPLFQCSLKNAVKNQLSEEERKKLNVQKEVFPYNLYTYDFFNKYSCLGNQWVDVEETRPFFTEDQYKEFLLNLKRTLPFYPQHNEIEYNSSEEWGYSTEYKSTMYWQKEKEYYYKSKDGRNTKTEHNYSEKFDYMEYAIFYCMQDVRCLAAIMKKFGSLLLGQGVQGIFGTPPFSMDLTAFRTASSIGYDYFLQTVMFKKDKDEWVPRHDWAVPKCGLRALIQKTIRGGRVMCRDNKKFHYIATCDADLVQDYDAVSLYPTAMSKLWLTDGVPKFIKSETGFSTQKFLELFAPPESTPEEAKDFLYQDGCIHIIHLNTKIKRHFPLLCIKDLKTKLNNYRNFDDEDVETWVNMIDLFNLIDFQQAEFVWDAAIVWGGERHYEIRNSITNLFNFRLQNHCKITNLDGTIEKHEHPIQGVAKLMMNSIFGKSILKTSNTEKRIIEEKKWRKDNNGNWTVVNNWEEFFRSNMYRIKRINPFPGTGKTEVEIYKRDTSSAMNIFGSNVLAMARRIIGRVMALAEDVEIQHPELSPGIFYTDTDSMHIRSDLLKEVEQAFLQKYGYEIKGEAMGNFHLDFDPATNFKLGEKTKGAKECWFIAKKLYADALLGDQGTIGYHMRMKGIPSDLLKFEYYDLIYNDKPFTFDLLQNGHISLYYDGGDVCSRRVMTRTIMTREARETLKRSRSQAFIETESEDEQDEPLYEKLFPPVSELHQTQIIEDDNTILLPPSVQEEIDESQIIDIN